ncbi:hypothetical protein THOM_0560 [Trachipleistophora hominis]|uniref:Uncharacterized protein n=1 Tax=Trachipleistophora hominis TaxID=72359 RepID=L7JZH2_TRAHO|nr:hypothetical protein THOM_0560 [Trachipleistophora hominis]
MRVNNATVAPAKMSSAKRSKKIEHDLENDYDNNEVAQLKIDLLTAYLKSLSTYNYYDRKNKQANLMFLKISTLLEKFLQFENKKRYNDKTRGIFVESKVVDKKETALKMNKKL